MRKILFIGLIMSAILALSAVAADVAVGEASYRITKDNNLKVSFDIKTDSDVVAVASAYDEDGRLLESKIVTVSGADTYDANFTDYSSIDYVKINVFGTLGVINPLCEQCTVDCFTTVDDTFIPMGPLFTPDN